MKIVYLSDFIPPRSVGGAAQSAFRAARKLAELGHEVHVITTVQERQFEGVEHRDGMTVYNLYSNYNDKLRSYVSIYNRATIPHIMRILRELKPDVVHADNIHFHISYAALKYARRYGKAVFATVRDFMSITYGKLDPKSKDLAKNDFKVSWRDNFRQAKKRFNPFRNAAIRHYFSYCDIIFSNSQSLADILAVNGIPGIVEMHNGLELKDVRYDKEAIQRFAKEHSLEGKRVVFFPARVSPAKGFFAAMDAMAEVIKKVPDAAIVIAGVQGRDLEIGTAYAAEKGIAAQTVFLGWTDRKGLDTLYFLSDVVVVPSLYPDPFPTVNLEAAMYKKPVVASAFGGGKEFVLDGETGYIVNPFDIQAMAVKITDLLVRPDVARNFGEAAFKRLITGFTVDVQVRRLLGWYEKILLKHVQK